MGFLFCLKTFNNSLQGLFVIYIMFLGDILVKLVLKFMKKNPLMSGLVYYIYTEGVKDGL